MSINIQKTIDKMVEMQKRGVTYSMYGSRTGVDGTADCSGAVYEAVKYGGGSKLNYIPSTETLHDYLLKNGYELIGLNKDTKVKKGDIFIWGKKGYSAGAGGHTGFVYDDKERIIHCNYSNNGVSIDYHDTYWYLSGAPYYYFYRPKNVTQDSVIKKGDTVTLLEKATHYQTRQVIPKWVKNKKYKVKQIKNVNQSKSKKAYLLEGINSWVLEQDVKK